MVTVLTKKEVKNGIVLIAGTIDGVAYKCVSKNLSITDEEAKAKLEARQWSGRPERGE